MLNLSHILPLCTLQTFIINYYNFYFKIICIFLIKRKISFNVMLHLWYPGFFTSSWRPEVPSGIFFFFSSWRTAFSTFYSIGLLTTNSPTFFLSENVFLFNSFSFSFWGIIHSWRIFLLNIKFYIESVFLFSPSKYCSTLCWPSMWFIRSHKLF